MTLGEHSVTLLLYKRYIICILIEFASPLKVTGIECHSLSRGIGGVVSRGPESFPVASETWLVRLFEFDQDIKKDWKHCLSLAKTYHIEQLRLGSMILRHIDLDPTASRCHNN